MDSLITISLCTYLALTIRRSGGIYGVLKLMLLLHVAGDYVSNSYWDTALTYYDFMKNVTDEMRLQGNLYLCIGVILADIGFVGAGSLLGEGKGLVRFHGIPDFSSSGGFGLFLLGIALLIKLYIGFQIGFFNVVPGDTIGYFGLYSIANTLIPIGAGAVFGLNVVAAVAFFTLVALFSYSKAQVAIYFVAYAVYCAYGYGVRTLLQKMASPKLMVIVALMILAMGFKTATRGGGDVGEAIEGQAILENAALAVDARLMGGIHRAYLTAVEQVTSGRMDTMGGEYHLQTLYLWIPRAFWSDKPSAASQELGAYLGAPKADEGTSYAVNPFGFFVVDFGLMLGFFGMFILGLGLRLAEAGLIRFASSAVRTSAGRVLSAGLIASWIMAAQPLSEGGVPPMIFTAVVSFSSCLAGYALFWVFATKLRDFSGRPTGAAVHGQGEKNISEQV